METRDDNNLLNTAEDGFIDWEDVPDDEWLEQALAGSAELESNLEQDEHPIYYNSELEDEAEETAAVNEKRLKRELSGHPL